MTRREFAFVTLLFLLAFVPPSVMPADARPAIAAIDQGVWAARKQHSVLPNGQRRARVALGPQHGEPLVLLHGWTDSSRMWSLAAPLLARDRRIEAFLGSSSAT